MDDERGAEGSPQPASPHTSSDVVDETAALLLVVSVRLDDLGQYPDNDRGQEHPGNEVDLARVALRLRGSPS